MATFNLVRNSRVFFTTNVNASTGVVATSGFTTANTQELQVLDGFTFGQTSNADTITISEAGSTPVRGQRSFNTSLAQADFSFSTYIRPYKDTNVKCEEAPLWNALMSSVPMDMSPGVPTLPAASSTGPVALDLTGSAGSTPTSVTWTAASGSTPGYYEFAVTSGLTSTLNPLGETLMVTGHADTNRNIAMKVYEITATGFKGVWQSNPTVIVPGSTGSGGIAGDTVGGWENVVFTRTAWNTNTAQAEVSSSLSNKNQLVKFGMIMVVDGITYIIDNCCMNQAVIDFGLDGIAMIAWTGMGTTLRQSGPLSVAFAAAPSSGTTTQKLTGGAVTGDLTGSSYTYKNTSADFITNKLSTVTLISGINGKVSGSAGTTTSLALTGGSITINNNVTYVTPANLGVVNTPVGYYTGTRAITGSVTAYLRTGSTNTAGLLSTLLSASTSSAGVEPKYQLVLSIGGFAATTKVEVEVPMAFLQIPTIDAAAVMSTTINFTAEGQDSTGSSIDIESANELEIRYFRA